MDKVDAFYYLINGRYRVLTIYSLVPIMVWARPTIHSSYPIDFCYVLKIYL